MRLRFRSLVLVACIVLLAAIAPSPADAVCGACGSVYGILACYADQSQTSCRMFKCWSEGGIGGIQWSDCCEDGIPCIA
ncbi:MAG: hypothetical protein PVG07_09340 [Acidobacteriota bacterium]|jgi:hypothetical protein